MQKVPILVVLAVKARRCHVTRVILADDPIVSALFTTYWAKWTGKYYRIASIIIIFS